MATIKIKRGSGTPTGLAEGELAVDTTANLVYVNSKTNSGDADNIIKVGEITSDGTQTLTNKTLTTPTLTSPVINTSVSGTAVLDEDNMSSNSATKLATQQSIKAYVDSQVGGVTTATSLNELTDVTLTSPATNALLKYNGSQWIDSTTITVTGFTSTDSSNTFQNNSISGNAIDGGVISNFRSTGIYDEGGTLDVNTDSTPILIKGGQTTYINQIQINQDDSPTNAARGRGGMVVHCPDTNLADGGGCLGLHDKRSSLSPFADTVNLIAGDVTGISSNTTVLYIFADGDIQNYNNSYGAISDETVKENIVDAGSQWEDIKAARVRKYNMIGGTETQIGVISQELEESGMSGLIKTGEHSGKKHVKYSVLYMKAIKALQEAMERIETLEDQVAALTP